MYGVPKSRTLLAPYRKCSRQLSKSNDRSKIKCFNCIQQWQMKWNCLHPKNVMRNVQTMTKKYQIYSKKCYSRYASNWMPRLANIEEKKESSSSSSESPGGNNESEENIASLVHSISADDNKEAFEKLFLSNCKKSTLANKMVCNKTEDFNFYWKGTCVETGAQTTFMEINQTRHIAVSWW